MEHLRWFSQVKCEERDCIVDCLVDLTQKAGDAYFLVEIDEKLKLIKSEFSIQIIGKAIKWSRDL